MARVFITYELPSAAQMMLEQAGHSVTTHTEPSLISPEALVATLGQYDAVITLLTDSLGADVLAASGPQLKIIANYAVGYDNIDVAAAAARGIVITNTPGVLTAAVAEHTIMLMAALARRVVEADSFTRAGRYEGWRPQLLLGTELGGKTLGIVGLGRIGADVARRAQHGFDMKILYHDRAPNAEFEKTAAATYIANLDELLAMADVVSLHVPLLPATRHLLSAARLKSMKPTALLVNTARGAIVDEVALVAALQQGSIRGAALDVFEHEPSLAAGLTGLPNVILTPHVASATEEARTAMAILAAKNVIAVLAEQPPLNPVAT